MGEKYLSFAWTLYLNPNFSAICQTQTLYSIQFDTLGKYRYEISGLNMCFEEAFLWGKGGVNNQLTGPTQTRSQENHPAKISGCSTDPERKLLDKAKCVVAKDKNNVNSKCVSSLQVKRKTGKSTASVNKTKNTLSHIPNMYTAV